MPEATLRRRVTVNRRSRPLRRPSSLLKERGDRLIANVFPFAYRKTFTTRGPPPEYIRPVLTPKSVLAGSFETQVLSASWPGQTDKVFLAPSAARRGLLGYLSRSSSFLRGGDQVTLNKPYFEARHEYTPERGGGQPPGCPKGILAIAFALSWQLRSCCGTVSQGQGDL